MLLILLQEHKKLAEDDTHFSADALKEISIMESLCNNILDELIILVL